MNHSMTQSWNKSVRLILFATLCVVVAIGAGQAQSPVPQIVGPVKPSAVAPGADSFTLSVYGANFVAGAVVNWNSSPRSTIFVSGHELQAQIPASDVAQNSAGLISVTNPGPGGGNSSASWAQVEVHNPVTSINLPHWRPYNIGFWSLMAADFNHDGVLDLVGAYSPYLDYYSGKGDGTFHFGSIAGRAYQGILPPVYGDFNGDGNVDVAFVQAQGSQQPTQMGVMLGDGKGNFTLGSHINDNAGFGLTITGDFNRDGKLDLVTRGAKQFSLFLGNGDGSFQHFKDYAYRDIAIQVVAGDFNNDGKLDLAFFESPIFGTNTGIALWVLLGNGDGTFETPKQISSFPAVLGCTGGVQFQGNIQVGDFNGDGKLDLAFCTNTQIGVVLGNGDGTFQPAVLYTASPQGSFTYAIGDINSDGKQDLLVSQYPGVTNYSFAVLFGNGDGTFQPVQTVETGITFGELGIVTGDFNADGLLDFVFQTGLGMDVFIQK
ncbi:MAG TPA: VCBS repeat-containing protein [Candidatus Solibacter sp.]|nr:VCBS repeat-containing protein [Candidatus Solibacter sp.]